MGGRGYWGLGISPGGRGYFGVAIQSRAMQFSRHTSKCQEFLMVNRVDASLVNETREWSIILQNTLSIEFGSYAG